MSNYQSNSGQWPPKPPPPPPPQTYPRRGNKQQNPGRANDQFSVAPLSAPTSKAGGNPFAEMLRGVQQQQQPLAAASGATMIEAPMLTKDQGGGGDVGDGGEVVPNPSPGGGDTPPPDTTPPPNPTPTPNEPPPNWTPGDWATVNQWLADATKQGYGDNYKWLLTTPNALRDYHADAENLKTLGIENVNFTDWARMKGYDSPIDRGSFNIPAGMAQRGGTNDQYQTMVRWLADGASKFGADAMRPYAQILSATPGFITSYYLDMDRAKAAGIEGIHFVDWLKYQNGAPSPLAGQMGQGSADAMAKWWALDHGGTGAGGTGGTPVPGGGGGGGTPVPTPTPVPPPTPPPTPPPDLPILPPGPPQKVPPPVNNGDPTLQNFDEILRKQIADYESRTNPLFQRQRDDISRRTAHMGAITGSLNSGGFGETLNDALGQQYAQEQATVAPQITQMTLAAQANALQKFSIDMNAVLQREQISTNADLERANQALQRYGIDQTTLLDRYKAELGLKGIQYSADRQVDAAALQAAAAHAAAAANAEAAKYAADKRYNTDLFQGDIAREHNIMDYILGIASLGPDWAKLILGSDPFGILTGNPPPGDVIVK